jgi:myo-inositol-1(or 4)-monophosphatase
MSAPNLPELATLAREAGRMLQEGFSETHEISYKGVIDPVTEMDRASERYLISEISRRWPDGTILSEENGITSGHNGQSWYLDPLDGTVNYTHRIPIFAVSLAFALNGRVQLGVVYDPMHDEMFTAERGRGAQLNGAPVHASGAADLRKSLLVTGFPYDAWDTEHDNFDNFVRLSKLTQGVRRFGSAALDCCWVAAGRFDGFWEISLNAWDVAAGGLIAEEAGAKVTNARDGADYLTAPQSIIAAAPGIHQQIRANLHRP